MDNKHATGTYLDILYDKKSLGFLQNTTKSKDVLTQIIPYKRYKLLKCMFSFVITLNHQRYHDHLTQLCLLKSFQSQVNHRLRTRPPSP